MPVIGVMTKDIEAKKKQDLIKNAKIGNETKITGVQERDLPGIGKKGLTVSFEFVSNYLEGSKNVAYIKMAGDVLFVDKDQGEIIKNWKKVFVSCSVLLCTGALLAGTLLDDVSATAMKPASEPAKALSLRSGEVIAKTHGVSNVAVATTATESLETPLGGSSPGVRGALPRADRECERRHFHHRP